MIETVKAYFASRKIAREIDFHKARAKSKEFDTHMRLESMLCVLAMSKKHWPPFKIVTMQDYQQVHDTLTVFDNALPHVLDERIVWKGLLKHLKTLREEPYFIEGYGIMYGVWSDSFFPYSPISNIDKLDAVLDSTYRVVESINNLLYLNGFSNKSLLSGTAYEVPKHMYNFLYEYLSYCERTMDVFEQIEEAVIR